MEFEKCMKRIVKPEVLDTLPANNPHAERSRRDIQRLNLLIGHDRIVCKALAWVLAGRRLEHITDLGAGNGHFLLSIAQRWHQRSTVAASLIDLVDGFDRRAVVEFEALGWKVKLEIADAVQWLGKVANHKEVVLANHFLHQLSDAELAALFAAVATSADGFISAEPRRRMFPLFCSHLVWFTGSGWVTCHDAPVSFRAGFRDRELSALWPDQKNWKLTEHRAGLFSHLFIAKRIK